MLFAIIRPGATPAAHEMDGGLTVAKTVSPAIPRFVVPAGSRP